MFIFSITDMLLLETCGDSVFMHVYKGSDINYGRGDYKIRGGSQTYGYLLWGDHKKI